MIEYITETGMFGILWVLLTIAFPFIAYKFIKYNPDKVIHLLPVIMILFLFNAIASGLIGKSRFDMALTLVKDMWFLMYHVLLMGVMLALDSELFNRFTKQSPSNNKTELMDVK